MPKKDKPAMVNITINIPALIKANVQTLQDFDFEPSFSEFARRSIRKLLLRDLPLINHLDYKNFENSVKEARGVDNGQNSND